MFVTLAGTRQTITTLLRRPFMTATAVLTLAAGMAASTATFILLHAALLAPLPYVEPDRLISAQVVSNRGFSISISVPNFYDFSSRNRVFTSSASSTSWHLTLSDARPARVLEVEEVLGDFFGTLGLQPSLGRVFSAAETRRGAAPEVVLGHSFFLELGGSPSLLGSTVKLSGHPYTIIGVLPPGVGYPSPSVPAYAPLGALGEELPWQDRDSSFGLDMINRLRPGATLGAAQRDLDRLTREIDAAEGRHMVSVRLQPLSEALVGDLRRPVLLLFAAGALLVLLATINVASLLVARAESRRGEILVRQALGAPHRDILRLLLTESCCLAAVGAFLGLLGAYGVVRFIAHQVGSDLPFFVTEHLRLTRPAVLFAAGMTVGLALLAGALPWFSLRSVRADRVHGQRMTASRQRGRFRSSLVVAQLALGVVLLVGSGLLLSTVQRLRHVDKGFDAEGVMVGRIAQPEGHFRDKAAWLSFYHRLLAAAETSRGVRSAAISLLTPLSHRSWEFNIYPEGVPLTVDGGDSVLFNIVSPSYFATLGVPLLHGRLFDSHDRDGSAPVAIVDESLARRYWPGGNAIGKRVVFDFDDTGASKASLGRPKWRTIVGVVHNLRHYVLQTPSRIQVYVPLDQTEKRSDINLELALRSEDAGTASLPSISRLVASIDPEVPVMNIRPLTANVERAMVEPVLVSSSVAAFGSLALFLSAVGVFALASFTVAERRREWAIRQAVGATPRRLLASVLKHGLSWCGWGAALGLAGALGAARLAQSLLFEVQTFDPASYGGAIGLLFAMVLLACLIPAVNATRTDPLLALREE